MTKKELTPEEQEEGRALNVRNTFESELIRKIIGGNSVKKNPFLYGQLGFPGGKQTYLDAMMSSEADDLRNQRYSQKLHEQQQLGIGEEPPYTSNYELVKSLKLQLGQVQKIARLEELEEHARKVGADLNFEVPENLKKYCIAEIEEKIYDNKTGKVDESKLTEEEKDAFGMYQYLTMAYERALAVNASQSNYFADINEGASKITDKYKKEEPEMLKAA
jgi:hypothetical protein